MKLLGSAPSNNLGVLGGNIFWFKKGGFYSCFLGGHVMFYFLVGLLGLRDLKILVKKRSFWVTRGLFVDEERWVRYVRLKGPTPPRFWLKNLLFGRGAAWFFGGMRSRCFVVFWGEVGIRWDSGWDLFRSAFAWWCFVLGVKRCFGCWKLDENSERELWADAGSTISGDYSFNF